MDDTSWAERIRWCEDAGMSRRQIADHCGLAYSTLNDILNGRTSEPRGTAAVRLHFLSEGRKPKESHVAAQ